MITNCAPGGVFYFFLVSKIGTYREGVGQVAYPSRRVQEERSSFGLRKDSGRRQHCVQVTGKGWLFFFQRVCYAVAHL